MLRIKKYFIVMTLIVLVNSLLFTTQPRLSLAKDLDELPRTEIETAEDLKNMSEDLDEHYLLTADIDLEDEDWKVIDEGEFTGTFVSDDYVIQNMPAEYVDHEYSGLFEAVAQEENLQVNVEFAEEVEDEEQESESEETEEAEEIEVPTQEEDEMSTEEELEKNETEQGDAEEEVSQEEETEETKEGLEEEVEEPEKSTRDSVEIDVEVRTHEELRTALEDKSVVEINLMNDIEVRSTSSNRIDIEKPRNIVIKGHGYQLKQTGTLNYAMFRVNTGDVDNRMNLTFEDIELVSSSGNSFVTEKSGSADWQLTFKNVNQGGAEGSTGRFVSAKHAHVTLAEGVYFKTSVDELIKDAKSVTVASGADVQLVFDKANASHYTTGRFYESNAIGAKLLVEQGAKLDLNVKEGRGSLILFKGDDSTIEVDGGELLVSSGVVFRVLVSILNTKSGLIKFTGDDAKFEAHNGGNVHVDHKQGSVLYMQSENGQVNVTGENTEVFFKVRGDDKDSDHDAVIHLNQVTAGYELNLDQGASLEVLKESGAAMGIRVGDGKGHKVNVKGKSQLKVRNKGDGAAKNPSGNKARNQALYYYGELPEFNLTGKGSEVYLEADNGVAMHMIQGGMIDVTEGTTFIARGKTETADRGVIDTGGKDDKVNSRIRINKPAFYDFRNNNTSGFVFHVGNGAEILGLNTDITVWKKGANVNLDGPHEKRFIGVEKFKYQGADLANLTEASTSQGLQKLYEQYPEGLKEFARLSGNNEQAFVDDLYVPTNADQKVYAHVSIDEGAFSKRDAYTDEVEIDLSYQLKDGTQKTLTGKTLGGDQFPGENAYKIYGKEVDPEVGAFGWVEIPLPDDAYLTEGETLEVTGARIIGSESDSEEGTLESDENHLFDGKRTVVDVTPPKPTELKELELNNYSRTLEGTLTEDDVDVVVEVNGQDAGGEVSYDRAEGIFTYHFNQNLSVEDRVQVFLQDRAGFAEGLGAEVNRPDRPSTNLEAGNRNPKEELVYHDRTFEAAPYLIVTEVAGELSFESAPSMLNFEVKVTPTAQSYLVDLEQLGEDLVIRDTRPEKTGWQLTAKMSKQLTATDDDSIQLKDALFYQEGDRKSIINDEDSVISSHEAETSEDENQEWNLSSDDEMGWGKGDNGLFIELEPGTLKKDYEGEVTWTLSDTP